MSHSYESNHFRTDPLQRSKVEEKEEKSPVSPSKLIENKSKKYSERHKDRVMGDIANKQISQLFDVSTLYDD